jgi:hypothetical protein
MIMKDGQLSKTAMAFSVGNALVLFNYALQSWMAGASFTFSFLKFTIPEFDAGDAAAILALLNGTYLANSQIKNVAAAAARR